MLLIKKTQDINKDKDNYMARIKERFYQKIKEEL